MPVTLRVPTAADAEALVDLGRATFVETFGDLYREEDLRRFLQDTYAPAVISRELADEQLIWQVAEERGKLIGYCKIYDGLSLDYDIGDQRAVQLNQLYIRASHLGTGIAQQLMDWALATAKSLGVEQMLLSVYCDNIRAQRFYQNYGFTHAGDTIFLVGSHVDKEFIYSKALI